MTFDNHVLRHALGSAAFAAAVLSAGSSYADQGATGLWIDHTGRGGVEITECGDGLCGRIVWLKEGINGKACGIQIIGDAKPAGVGRWDGGWIYDPEKRSRFNVELTLLNPAKLQVKGYARLKFLSKTFVWNRAPEGLPRCAENAAKAPAGSVKSPDSQPAPPAAEQKAAPQAPATTEQQPQPADPEDAPAEAHSSKQAQVAPRNCRLEVPYVTLSFPCD